MPRQADAGGATKRGVRHGGAVVEERGAKRARIVEGPTAVTSPEPPQDARWGRFLEIAREGAPACAKVYPLEGMGHAIKSVCTYKGHKAWQRGVLRMLSDAHNGCLIMYANWGLDVILGRVTPEYTASLLARVPGVRAIGVQMKRRLWRFGDRQGAAACMLDEGAVMDSAVKSPVTRRDDKEGWIDGVFALIATALNDAYCKFRDNVTFKAMMAEESGGFLASAWLIVERIIFIIERLGACGAIEPT